MASQAQTSLPALVKKLVTDSFGMSDADFTVVDGARLATPYGNETPEPARMGIQLPDGRRRSRSLWPLANVCRQEQGIASERSEELGGAGQRDEIGGKRLGRPTRRRGGPCLLPFESA
jgi:hypothetical protein